MKRYLAVDIGASSGRHILAELKGGILHCEEIYRFPNGAKEVNGRLYWDTDRLFQEILAGLKKAGEIGKAPDYVGIDTWAVDYVLLGEKGERVGDVYAYRDARGGIASEKVHERIPFPALYARTGIQFQPFNTIYQLYDDKETGRQDEAHGFLMLPDYFHYLLTGVKKQEYTNATSTGMVNAETHTWDAEILSALGYNEKLFGTLSQPGSVVGAFKKEIADAVGYNATVILPATHDTASAVLAAPITERAPYISSGTWSLLGIENEGAVTSEEARHYNYSNEGSLRQTFRFQKNIMGLWMIQQVRKELGDGCSFAELAALAEKSPIDVTVDVNDNRFLAPKSMLAEMESVIGKRTVGEIAYCIFNSLAESYKKAIEELEEMTGARYDKLHIIGGGSQNKLLNRLTAEKTGKTVVLGPTECTAIGNVLMQMIGTGDVKDLAEARKIIRNTFEIEEVTL
ncbi:MAG: rhamnulokinase [Clostridia bacterium]|nr:rhamnulokinase [Clostridia bacterium]